MTIAEWCLFGALFLTIATIGWAKTVGRTAYDNARPRDSAFYADPLRARLLAAHQNGYEAFPFFAAAVLLAEFRAAPQPTIDGLAIAFLALRVGYVIAYATGRATPRSLLWTAAFLINVAIFFLPALA
jgi:uncharacterized MAPEG superfamily protein